MKLLIFSPYYPPHIGGLESHADEFNKYLSQKGADITVFTPLLPASALKFETIHNNVKIYRFPAFEIISNYPLPKFWNLEFWKLFFLFFKEDFDVVISRTRFFNTSLMALIYAKITKTKWMHIEHGSDFIELSSKTNSQIAKLYDLTFGKLIFHFSDINVSISEAVKKFVHKFDRRESPIIYRGINTEEIDSTAPDSEFKNKFEGKIIISFLGRLYKWKGVEHSIRAIKSLPSEIKDKVIFVIMGDGEDMEKLKKISDESIFFTGALSHGKALGILKISDIYIHSAFPGGGLSTALLEAMYCKCAIIATPNEGADEVVRHHENGLLISNPNEQEITATLEALIKEEKLRQSIAEKGFEEIKENFKWENAINRYEKLLAKL